jgi:hypothetical protein
MPVPAKDAGGWASWGPVWGSPGTNRVPAPYPAAVPQGVRYRVGANRHSSEAAPPYWLPGIYYARPASRSPVSTLSDNQMPVPAIPYQGTPSAAVAVKATFLGQVQVRQPKVVPHFPAARPRRG